MREVDERVALLRRAIKLYESGCRAEAERLIAQLAETAPAFYGVAA